MKRFRYWRRGLISLVIIVALFLFVFYTETALRWGVSLVSGNVLKPLSVAEVHGRLAGPFTLNGVDYDEAGYHVLLEEITVDWKPSALLRAAVHITELKGEGFHFTRTPQPAEPLSENGPVTLPLITFPLALTVDDASIDGVSLNLPNQPTPLTITQLALSAETKAETLLVHSLRLQSDRLTLDMNGYFKPSRDYDLKLNLSWQLQLQDFPPWKGKGILKGNVKTLELQQTLTSPFAASLALQGNDVIGDFSWNGFVSFPRIKSSQLPFPISPVLSVGGRLKAEGTIDSFSGTGTFSGQVEKIGAVKGNIAASYANSKLHLTQLVVNQKKGPARIEADGDIELTKTIRYQLQSRWQTLGWPLDNPAVLSEKGQLHLSGEDSQYQLDGDFLLTGSQIPRGNWRIKGKGDDETLTIRSLEGQVLDGSVKGNANVAFSPQVKWNVKLAADALDPGVKWSEWPGHVSLEASVNGQLASSGIDMDVVFPSLTGSLRGHKLNGEAKGDLRGDTASLKRLNVQLGTAHLQANGVLGHKVRLDWKLDANDLADLLPLAQGQIKAKGSITGPQTTPKISLLLDGNGLTYVDIHADRLHIDLDVDMQSRNPSRAKFQLQQLQLPGMPQQSLTLNVDGSLDEHRLTLESHSVQQILQLAATAGYSANRWAGNITHLQIDDKDLGQWQLLNPASFSLMSTDMHLDEFCLNHAEANLCAGGQWTDKIGAKANLRGTRFPLQLLAPYMPRRFAIEAVLNGKASLAMLPDRTPQLQANLNLGQGELHLLSAEDESTQTALPFQKAELSLDTSEQGKVVASLVLSFNDNDQLALAMNTTMAPDWPASLKQQPLQAHLQITLRDLSTISALLPEVQSVKGEIDADVRLTGTLSNPKLSGYIRLGNGQLDIPRAGLSLSGVQLTASGDNTQKMEITGKARSGDGNLTIDGQLVPTDKGMWALELTMKGKNFVVANIPEARVQVSPDLQLRMVGREIHLSGDLEIPSARLEPPDIKLVVKPSDDVVVLGGGEEKAKQERWLIYTSVRVHATDSIRFIGYGFDGRIGGDLLLIDEPGSLTRARGELGVVSGSNYEAFGKRLTIDRGRLNFADSPADNPNLDIRASRTIGDVVAGVNVTGTAKKPVLTLFSEPPMDQADILSYLTLGHPVSSANKGEGETLAGAANSAGLVGGNYLAGYFSRQFGLEEARVETGPDSQSTWLVVGKYLSPRLYIRYGVGFYEDAYSVLVRYKLTEHWQVQGEGGLHSGGDIIYTFERP